MSEDTAQGRVRSRSRRTSSADTLSGKDTKYQQRYSEILQVAAEVFAAKGYHGASTKDIADRLGIRQGSLYYYFASKQEALAEVCVRGVDEFFATITRIASEPGHVEDRLRAAISAHLSPMLNYRAHVKVFLKDRKDLESANRRKVGASSRAYEAAWQGMIEEGMRSGQFRSDLDARTVVLGILGMMNATFDWFDGAEADLDRIADDYADLLLSGLRQS